ncbi:MAG: CPBP family intramembrane metalloprotease [Proteobacteria bacterium]|nr:CPBP family intramembrane metalloprotease [Pseudomonadota bacterium]
MGADDLLLILIVTLGSVRLLVWLLVGLSPVPGSGLDPGNALLAAMTVLLFQTAVILAMLRAVVIRKYGLSWADLGLRPAGRHWYRRAVIIAVLLLPTVALVNSVLIPMLAEEPFRNPQLYAIAPAGFSWSALLTMLVMAGVVAPFAEELVFRGLLFPWLRTRLGVPAAVLLSALCFATLHGAAIFIPALTVVGAAFAVIYQRCGSLWPAIVAHSVFNGIMIVVLYALLAAGVKLP